MYGLRLSDSCSTERDKNNNEDNYNDNGQPSSDAYIQAHVIQYSSVHPISFLNIQIYMVGHAHMHKLPRIYPLSLTFS